MSQKSMRMSWSPHEVDEKLKSIMSQIHDSCVVMEMEGDFIDCIKILQLFKNCRFND